MKVATLSLNGFRNFKQATINLEQKSLIIGSNDVGKSNAIHALRMLLDRSLSETDIEPLDSDFFAGAPTDAFSILIKFVEVAEDCVLSRFKEHVSDSQELFLQYRAERDPTTRVKRYFIEVGPAADELTIVDNRFYLRVLNLRYIGSRRDLHGFIKRERRHLLEDARENRTAAEKAGDAVTFHRLEKSLQGVTKAVTSLAFVQRATKQVNDELATLSHHHVMQEVVFDAVATDPSEYVDGVNIVSRIGGKSVPLSGDGRSNQVHFALWAARNKVVAGEPMEVSIFCVEEPEAHLHPHQQRRLSRYLVDVLDAQVVMTSHSPQIACEFPPEALVRLVPARTGTTIAGNGCNLLTQKAVLSMSFRMGLIPAEALFASAVLLVEGPSEEILYKALAEHVGIDLDHHNISVVPVDGVGFGPFASLLSSLSIPFAIRTDNDVGLIPKRKPVAYRMDGLRRAVRLASRHSVGFDATTPVADVKRYTDLPSPVLPASTRRSAQKLCKQLARHGIFVAGADLESDLYDELGPTLENHYGTAGKAATVAAMQKRKADNMFLFCRRHSKALRALGGGGIARPLNYVAGLIKGAP